MPCSHNSVNPRCGPCDRKIKGNLTVCGDLNVQGNLTLQDCLTAQGELNQTLTLSSNCVTLGCDTTLDSFRITVKDKVVVEGPSTELPFNSLSDGTIPEGDSLVTDGISLTNTAGDGIETGPFYVEDGTNVVAPDTTKVITCGNKKTFAYPYIGYSTPAVLDSTLSTITITQDATAPANSNAMFDLNYGFSTEVDYDFIEISRNGELLLKLSGAQNDQLNPYIHESLSGIILGPSDTITLALSKDGSWYSGNDTIYFYLKNLSYLPQPIPTQLNVIRDSEVVLEVETFIEGTVDDIPVGGSEDFVKSFDFQQGDQICLVVDDSVYTSFNVCINAIKRFDGNVFEEVNNKACVTTNALSLNLQKPVPNAEISGWYKSDGDNAYILIEDQGSQLKVEQYDSIYAKKNLMQNNISIRSQYITPAFWTKTDGNKYTVTSSNTFNKGLTYIFDPSLKKFTSDFTNPVNVVGATIEQATTATTFLKMGNPVSEVSKYNLDLQNSDQVFNSPIVFFDMIHDFYLSGQVSTFTDETEPMIPEINPLNLDLTQVKRNFGGDERDDYEDKYIKLRDKGILRKYPAKKFVYWQDPNDPTGIADLDPSEQDALVGLNAQQRFNTLTVYLDHPEENTSPNEYARFCPGEHIIMKGSGTRLDNIPLRLAIGGFHTGPKPGKEFIPDYQYDFWTYYTIRLPLVVDPMNNTLFMTPPGGVSTELTIPEGNYTITELMDTVNNIITSEIPDAETGFQDRNLYINSVYDFYEVNQLIFEAAEDTILNSPDHPTEKSTLLGNLGLNLGYLFGGDTLTADDFGFILGSDPAFNYQVHTPLTSAEAQDLLSNIGTITLEAMHGPISNDMSYEKFVACIMELNNSYCTEVHATIAPYVQKIDHDGTELFTDFNILRPYLNALELVNESIPFSQSFFNNQIGVAPIRGLGCGQGSEFSEMYTPSSSFRSLVPDLNRNKERLDWIVPNDRMFYPQNTISPVGNVSLEQVSIPIVNYLEEPLWLVSRPGGAGETTFALDPYSTNQFFSDSNLDDSPVVRNPNIVTGDYLIGVLSDTSVIKALGGDPGVKIGYITNAFTDISFNGDPTLLNWWDPNYETTTQIGRLAAGIIIKYFNENNVQHIIIDQRNTGGGLFQLWEGFSNLVGGDRPFNSKLYQNVVKNFSIDNNGTAQARSQTNAQKFAEDEGVLTYQNVNSLNDCHPSDWEAIQGPNPLDFPENSTFKAIDNQPENQKRIIWLTNSTTISATQGAYLSTKSNSLVQNSTTGFDGDLGNNVQLVGYGCYYRPFSSSGSYSSFVNWYTKGREGTEKNKNPPMFGIDRYDTVVAQYIDNGVVKSSGQDFTRLHQPNIKWNMNADIFFQDIGYTKNAVVPVPPADGEPWTDKRYDDVNFQDPLTWRDSALEKSLVILTDPTASTHYFQDDGFYDI